MNQFFNKSSFSFIGRFFLFLLASMAILIGFSVYAKAQGVDVVSTAIYFLGI